MRDVGYVVGNRVAHITLTGFAANVLCPWGQRFVDQAGTLPQVVPMRDVEPSVPWCARCQSMARQQLAPALPEVAEMLKINGKVRRHVK